MAWNYNAVPSREVTDELGRPTFCGIKITKTFVDDSGNELFTTDATVEEALVEAEPEFIVEYAEAARLLFQDQLNYLLNYSEGSRQDAPSSGATILGFELRTAVETLNRLAGLS